MQILLLFDPNVFFFLVWTLALQPLFDLSVLIILSVWKCWWHRNTAWYSLCSSLTGNTTDAVMWISPVGDYGSCKKNAGSTDDAEEKRLLSNLPGHTNDIWRGLPTGASLAKVITLPGFNSRLSQRANYSRVWQIAQIIKHRLAPYSSC